MVAASATISPIRLFPPGSAAAPTRGTAIDAYGRAMTYLRISLTDRCNFRCLYCMPAVGMKFQPREEHLTDEELLQIDRFVRRNTTEKFGPVRHVVHEPDQGLVLEVAFEGLARSPRHKSGVAMRFPRISRLRWDKPPREADRLETLERMLRTVTGN